jgi:hypothetical protein
MPYIVLKSCVADGARRSAGDILNLSDDEARSLTAMGRVEYADAPRQEPIIEDRSVALPQSKVAAPRKRKSFK